jgi:hypothetical protein
MLELGQTRRELGQRRGQWSWDQTLAMLAHMGADTSGHVSEADFVRYFEAKLPDETLGFERNIAEFLASARRLRQKRKAEERVLIRQAILTPFQRRLTPF